MNKILATLVSWTAGLSAFAQLGAVDLSNNFTPLGGTARALILGWDGLPMVKKVGSIDILDSNGNVIKSGRLGADGLFFLGETLIPGTTPRGSATIMIRAWDNTTGSSFATATVRGSSIVTLTGLGGGAIPPPGLRTAGNFTGLQLQLIPEPSTVALAALGMVGLLFVARRK